jgi:hypothetical protein
MHLAEWLQSCILELFGPVVYAPLHFCTPWSQLGEGAAKRFYLHVLSTDRLLKSEEFRIYARELLHWSLAIYSWLSIATFDNIQKLQSR